MGFEPNPFFNIFSVFLLVQCYSYQELSKVGKLLLQVTGDVIYWYSSRSIDFAKYFFGLHWSLPEMGTNKF